MSPARLRIYRARSRISLARVYRINVELNQRRLELLRDLIDRFERGIREA